METDEQRDRRLQRQSEYRARNRDKLKKAAREYRKRNADAVKQRAVVRREKNRDGLRERARKYRERMTAILHEARNRPCGDCGMQLPASIMEFDHVRGEKGFTISHWEKQCRTRGTGRTREELLKEEIAKCEIRCPNCHRLRHYLEGSGNFASEYPPRKG